LKEKLATSKSAFLYRLGIFITEVFHDFLAVFQAATKGRMSALITIGNSLLNRYQKQIAGLAIRIVCLRCTISMIG